MADASFPVNNLLATAKSREVQRGMLAEARGDRSSATLHFLAAANMELVLAADHDQASNSDMAYRTRLSAASCFWRAGKADQARPLFDRLLQDHPDRCAETQQILAELTNGHPALAS